MAHMKQFEHLKIQLEDVKSATNNFSDESCIGRGGFGKVYKGNIARLDEHAMVALKRLDRVYGDRLTWIGRLKVCIGAARGLAYLHDAAVGTQQRVLHRDIKSSNILLDENWNAKISDFGLSKFGPANQKYTFLFSNPVGTLGYCDPLYAENGFLTKESDVYSFGVVLFEVLCGRLCIDKRNSSQSLVGLARKSYEQNTINEIVCGNIRDEINHESLKVFTTIGYRCLKRDREERPLMSEVVKALETALQYHVSCYV
ncbi:hypothetical protein SSX86_027597 [Deinandra increscens subsp. villosa]|uniref:Protein kinase domain-containing protein n=1 Tax=Deinandra increscens subsp. villosa TaxID=3103831 RepID=A0AAP0CBE9_9ASTR